MKQTTMLTALLAASTMTATTATFAFDYKINLESRVDFLNTNTETTSNTAGAAKDKDTENSFSLQTLRLNLAGAVNENLSYRFRYRLNKENGDTTRDSASKNIDFIYVDHKLSGFTLRLGKQSWSESYGRESFVSGSDAILTSLVKTNHGSANGEYRMGLTAMAKLADVHNVSLSVSNPNTSKSSTTGRTNNEALAYGVNYNSSLLDKLVQPTFSYQLAKQNGDKNAALASQTKTVTDSLLAVGVRSQFSDLTLDLDHKTFSQPNKNAGTNSTAANKKDKTTSMTATLAYSLENLTPFVMYYNDKFESDVVADKFKKNSYAVGVMYKPFADLNYRYHLVYVSTAKKWESSTATNSKENVRQVVLGFKADI